MLKPKNLRELVAYLSKHPLLTFKGDGASPPHERLFMGLSDGKLRFLRYDGQPAHLPLACCVDGQETGFAFDEKGFAALKSFGNLRYEYQASPVELGNCYYTPGATALAEEEGVDLTSLLFQHAKGEWGNGLCKSDAKLNDQALKDGSRLFSSYLVGEGRKVWIITEADRSYTTVLLPEEY